MISNTIGCILGGMIFENNYNKTDFFSVMSAFALIAAISMMFLRKPSEHKSKLVLKAKLNLSSNLNKTEDYFTERGTVVEG